MDTDRRSTCIVYICGCKVIDGLGVKMIGGTYIKGEVYIYMGNLIDGGDI